ncbi:MAG: hypothetical protein APF84_06655 [Gracilibacter sp. BRH_c7a]|nr:MAG: hypothetical protein APF84_06655 [Gracilibacter sp. BRH_c7a]
MPIKNKSAIILITVSMLIVGIFSMIIVKAYQKTGEVSRPDSNLPSLLQLEIENEQLTKENEKLWKELTRLQAGQSAAALASEQLEEGRLNAGFTPLTGSGIRIILDDSDQEERTSQFANYVIHEEYIRSLVNILWNGGAEAIAVNDQRITTHAEIFCSGAYIQINGTRQMPPYEILAIGNQNNLQSALQFYFWDKLGEYQQQYGITRTLEVPEEPIIIPAAKEYNYRYAEPVKEG